MSCADGTNVTIANGQNGGNGSNGTNGQPCSVSPFDGGVTVTCPGSPPVSVPNGAGPCTVAQIDGGVTVSCPGSPPVTVLNGQDVSSTQVVDFSLLSAAEIALLDPTVTVTGVTNAARPVVSFKVLDTKLRGVKNIPPAYFNGLVLLKLEVGDTNNGKGNDTWRSYVANCPTCVSTTETASATSLVSAADGSYTYTFVKDIQNPIDGGTSPGTSFSATATTRLLFRLATSGNPFRPVDVVYEYVPSTGAVVTGANEKVNTDNCLECHGSFRAAALNAGGVSAFHSGQRYLVPFCYACHNDSRKYVGTAAAGNAVIAEPSITANVMTPPAGQTSIAVLRGEAVLNLPVWIHKIHRGELLTLSGPYPGLGAEVNAITFPQDQRNCTKCHKNAPLADNWKSKPSARVCGACHDNVNLVTGTGHLGGPQSSDNACGICHPTAAILANHLPLAPIDPNNIFSNPDGGSGSTNAATLANPAYHDGGAIISYVLPDSGVNVTTGSDGGTWATVKFKMLKDGVPVVFNAYDGGSTAEMVDNFVNSSSVQCAFTVPQDGLPTPADFNATASAYIKTLWKAGTLTGPDSAGNYTATLNGTSLPANATMLTCGIGYSYSLTSTPPLTQTDVPGFPYSAATKVGGFIIPARNVWQVGVGFTGRRGATASTSATGQVVATAKCEGCHAPLGVTPTFHAGQRNDAATCAFCHTPNRTSSGWSANAGSYIHAIHAAGIRATPFTWNAESATGGFYDVTFPGRLQNCETCHNPGMYDFSGSWYTANGGANIDNRMVFTAATANYNSDPVTNPNGYFRVSPYVVSNLGQPNPDGGSFFPDGGSLYGAGFSFSGGVTTQAAPTTLVHSPIAGACFGCHDTAQAMAHMRTNGASLYAPRSQALVTTEQCLICHGPGKIAPIKDIHSK